LQEQVLLHRQGNAATGKEFAAQSVKNILGRKLQTA
jgi:hypothetical protein